jgi:ribosomal protein S10
MSQRIRIKLQSYDHNLVDKSAEKIVKNSTQHRSGGYRPHSFADKKKDIHCTSFTAREQEST